MRGSDERLLTVPVVAQRLSLGKSLVYQLITSGELPSLRIHRSRRVAESALAEWLEEKARETSKTVK